MANLHLSVTGPAPELLSIDAIMHDDTVQAVANRYLNGNTQLLAGFLISPNGALGDLMLPTPQNSMYPVNTTSISSYSNAYTELASLPTGQPIVPTFGAEPLSYLTSAHNTIHTNRLGDTRRGGTGGIGRAAVEAAVTTERVRPVATRGTTKFKCFCTYCPGTKKFGLPSDWKSHETKKHESERLWNCPHDRCQTRNISFSGILKHHKSDHDDCPDECQPNRGPCSKQVFACGFLGCTEVFEDDVSDSPSGEDAWYKRCRHLTGHFSEGKTKADWNRNTMVVNLLRQRQLMQSWNQPLYNMLVGQEQSMNSFYWEEHVCRLLQARLGSRNFYLPGVDSDADSATIIGAFSERVIRSQAQQFPTQGSSDPSVSTLVPIPVQAPPPAPHQGFGMPFNHNTQHGSHESSLYSGLPTGSFVANVESQPNSQWPNDQNFGLHQWQASNSYRGASTAAEILDTEMTQVMTPMTTTPTISARTPISSTNSEEQSSRNRTRGHRSRRSSANYDVTYGLNTSHRRRSARPR